MEVGTKLDWDTFVQNCQQLAEEIKGSGFEPSLIVAVARGGWIPARILAEFLGVEKMASIGIEYQDKERTQLKTYSVPTTDTDDQILLVEDTLESGKSLQEAQRIFERAGNLVRTCSLYYSPQARIHPYYSLGEAEKMAMPWNLEEDNSVI